MSKAQELLNQFTQRRPVRERRWSASPSKRPSGPPTKSP